MLESKAEALNPLRRFIERLADLVDSCADEGALLAAGSGYLAQLISARDWLPQSDSTSKPDRYVQNLLHCDPLDRFSVVSFVWGPGQATPVRGHTVWGLVGILLGAELSEAYELRDGMPVGTGITIES